MTSINTTLSARIKAASDWLRANTWLLWAAGTASIIKVGLSTQLSADASPLLRSIFHYTAWFGTFSVLAMPWVRMLMSGKRPKPHEFFFGFTWLVLICTVLTSIGDGLIAAVQASPAEAAAIAVSLLLVQVVLSLSRPEQRAVEIGYAAGQAVAGLRHAAKHKPSAVDDKHTAAHEAGHALAHAALASLPGEFVAVVEPNRDTDSLGYVTSVNDGSNLLLRKSFAEWRMLMLLSGIAAEQTLYGAQTLGGQTDYRMWLDVAQQYLSTGVNGAHYADPQNEMQMTVNKEGLLVLQRYHEAILADFFSLNRKVLQALTDALLEHRRLDAQALAPYMTLVQFPAGFTRPE